jgi:hypothetical protein
MAGTDADGWLEGLLANEEGGKNEYGSKGCARPTETRLADDVAVEEAGVEAGGCDCGRDDNDDVDAFDCWRCKGSDADDAGGGGGGGIEEDSCCFSGLMLLSPCVGLKPASRLVAELVPSVDCCVEEFEDVVACSDETPTPLAVAAVVDKEEGPGFPTPMSSASSVKSLRPLTGEPPIPRSSLDTTLLTCAGLGEAAR